MKKLFIFMGALLFGLGALGLKGNEPVKASALTDGEAAALKTMMGKYIDAYGKYTKKSHIYLKTSTPDFETYFHAGATASERTTYYSNNALLMGDIDGTFTHINSGYANNGANMDHFRSEDGLAALSLADRRTVDYTVEGKQMSDYFFDLHDLVNSIDASDWAKNGDDYYHNITTLGLDENNEFKDPLLKKFQYFTAPMLLQTANHYLSYKSIVINETSGYLHIAIYLSEGDSGKVDAANSLLAEACVFAGHATPGYYLVGSYGSDHDWQIESGRPFGAGNAENLAILTGASIPAGQYKVCQLKADGWTTWYGLCGSEDNNNLEVVVGGTFNFFLSKNEGTYGYIYRERTSHESVNITFTINYGTVSGQEVYLVGSFNDWTVGDAEYKLSWTDGNNWVGTFAFEGGTEFSYKFVVHGNGNTIWESDPNRTLTPVDTMSLTCSWR